MALRRTPKEWFKKYFFEGQQKRLSVIKLSRAKNRNSTRSIAMDNILHNVPLPVYMY